MAKGKPFKKMNYYDCLKLIGKRKIETLLFNEDFFNKYYEVKLYKVKENVISVTINGDEFVYLCPDETGFVFVPDIGNIHASYKANLANLFLPNQFRLGFNKNDGFVLSKNENEKYNVNKMIIISKDGGITVE